MRGRSQACRRNAFVLTSVATFWACGGSPTGPPESRPDLYPPIKTVLLEDAFRLAPGAGARFDIRVPESNPDSLFDLFAEIDWTHASNNVVAAFGGESCGGVNLALAGHCMAGVHNTHPSHCPTKPRVVTMSATSGSLVRLYVANTGASFESGRVQVVSCRDAPGCAEGAACAQCLTERWRIESCPL